LPFNILTLLLVLAPMTGFVLIALAIMLRYVGVKIEFYAVLIGNGVALVTVWLGVMLLIDALTPLGQF
jgi:hypothetical protein